VLRNEREEGELLISNTRRNSESVSVVIVNYLSETLTARCIRSITQAEPALAQELDFIIVDNGSKEDWPALLEGLGSVSLIECEKNLGFAEGANRGMRVGSGEYIFLINPDSLVCPGALSRAVAFMRDPANSSVAILGPKVFDDPAKRSVQFSARSFPGFAQALFGRYSLLTRLWPSNPWSRRYLKNDCQHDSPMRVDWVSGCCMLIRRKALDEIGLFDENYFMYVEDVDLCRRAWEAGWQVAYFPGAEVTHQIGGSSKLRPIRMIVEHHRSMWIYYRKFFHHGPCARFVVLSVICARALLQVAGGSIQTLWKMLRGHSLSGGVTFSGVDSRDHPNSRNIR